MLNVRRRQTVVTDSDQKCAAGPHVVEEAERRLLQQVVGELGLLDDGAQRLLRLLDPLRHFVAHRKRAAPLAVIAALDVPARASQRRCGDPGVARGLRGARCRGRALAAGRSLPERRLESPLGSGRYL